MMKFLQKTTMESDVDNSASEINNNRNEGVPHNTNKNQITEENLKESNSIHHNLYSSRGNLNSTQAKSPTHFHHPEYLQETPDNRKSSIISSSRKIVSNHHPGSGVDYSSIMEWNTEHWESSAPIVNRSRSTSRRSWYSHLEDEEETEKIERIDPVKEEKRRKNVEEIKKLPCSLGKMVIEEQERIEADLEKQGLDPRLTSRSPNASNPVVTKSRYKSPINASPSRTLREAREQTKSVQCLFSQQNDNQQFNESSKEENEVTLDNGTFIVVNRDLSKGVSMPEIAKNIKVFPYHVLSTKNHRLPKGVDRTRLEQHLTCTEFEKLFGMSRDSFWRLPRWKRMELKKKLHLF